MNDIFMPPIFFFGNVAEGVMINARVATGIAVAPRIAACAGVGPSE